MKVRVQMSAGEKLQEINRLVDRREERMKAMNKERQNFSKVLSVKRAMRYGNVTDETTAFEAAEKVHLAEMHDINDKIRETRDELDSFLRVHGLETAWEDEYEYYYIESTGGRV